MKPHGVSYIVSTLVHPMGLPGTQRVKEYHFVTFTNRWTVYTLLVLWHYPDDAGIPREF